MRALFAPVPASALAFFRAAFGIAIFIGAARYLGYGWVTELYVTPEYHFTYWGFDWVKPWPGIGMHVHYALMGVLGLCVAAGLFYRASIALVFGMFTYVELIDKTAYLNHYYFVSLVALLMIFMPLHRAYSLDVRRKPELKRAAMPAWCVWIVRFQLGCVYVFAGIAKLEKDWLMHGEPMSIWLAARTDFPLVGHLFDLPWLGQAMSIAGCLFDLTIVVFLLWRPTRLGAYLTVVVFHVATGLLFNIGLFPLIMIALTPIFFDPDWPRRLWAKFKKVPYQAPELPESLPARSPLLRQIGMAALALYVALQLALPMRHLLYPGNVLWNQEGWRFSWRVMLIEKSGFLKFEVRDAESERRWVVYPRTFLNDRQLQLATGSPDMILQLAHHIAADYRSRGVAEPQVFADAHLSLNGRPSTRFIDPTVDLAKEPRGLGHFDWVLPEEAAAR